MKKVLCASLFIILGWGLQAQNLDNEKYLNYVFDCLQNTSGFDALQVRELYAKTTFYSPSFDAKVVRKLQKMVDTGDFTDLNNLVIASLREQFGNVSFHYWAMLAFEKVKNDHYSRMHQLLFIKLLESLHKTGDGKSKASAYRVLSADEEFLFLQYEKCKVLKQTSQPGDVNIDVFEVADSDGKNQTLYFNVDVPYAWMAAH